MQRVMVVAAIVFGLCMAYALAHLALIEVGREVVILHKWTPGGTVHKTRLWIVEEGRYALHHGYPDSAWIRRLEADPIVRSSAAAGRATTARCTPETFLCIVSWREFVPADKVPSYFRR